MYAVTYLYRDDLREVELKLYMVDDLWRGGWVDVCTPLSVAVIDSRHKPYLFRSFYAVKQSSFGNVIKGRKERVEMVLVVVAIARKQRPPHIFLSLFQSAL